MSGQSRSGSVLLLECYRQQLLAAKGAHAQGVHTSSHMQKNSIEVGRFYVSPMTLPDPDGQFVASVSIRSGQGAASTDRIWRFEPRFGSADAALRFAQHEGIAWALRH